MNSSPNSKRPPDPSELIALIDEIVAYWKEIAFRNFTRMDPDSAADDFESRWPKILANFFLAQTMRTAKALRVLSDGRLN